MDSYPLSAEISPRLRGAKLFFLLDRLTLLMVKAGVMRFFSVIVLSCDASYG